MVCVRLSGEVWAGQLGARDVVVVKAAGLLGWPSEVQPMEAAESVRSVGGTSALRSATFLSIYLACMPLVSFLLDCVHDSRSRASSK